jgi:hypothetical protein
LSFENFKEFKALNLNIFLIISYLNLIEKLQNHSHHSVESDSSVSSQVESQPYTALPPPPQSSSLPPQLTHSHSQSHTHVRIMPTVSLYQNMDVQKDPRLICGAAVKKRRNYTLEPLDLPMPKFKHDQYWIGPVPAKECTFVNLNDNIDKSFLEEMCVKYGEIIDCKIYYHPKTKKHLGLAKVLFLTQRSARECCQGLDQTTKMGNKMNVFIDTMGAERTKMIDLMCNGVKPPQPYAMSQPNAALTTANMPSFDTSATNSPIVSNMPKSTTITAQGASSSSSPSSTAYPSNLFAPPTSLIASSESNLTSAQLPDSSSSLDSRIAALFNLNMPGIPGLPSLGGGGGGVGGGGVSNSASSSTLASSSSSSSNMSSMNVNLSTTNISGISSSSISSVGPSSSLMPNATSTSFHFEHFSNSSNFVAKSPSVTGTFQVICVWRICFKRLF